MKAWRESASMIITARNALKQSQYDYNLLFLRRKKTGKYSNAYVFPGGVIESADADLKWHNLFKTHGFSDDSFKFLFPSTKSRPEIFHSKKNELPREISLRISAIRETFEECGILLCRKSTETASTIEQTYDFSVSNDDLEFWQKKVHSDAREFYTMCENFQCYPNLWALYEYANWLTPTTYPAAQRFNTAFFFTSLSQMPSSKLDLKEMQELLWTTPDYVQESLMKYLPPPQQYEIKKMAKYKKLDDLREFALEKSKKGVELYLPVRVILSDGNVFVYPGDSMYPEKLNFYEEEVLEKSNMTIEEFREISEVINRIEMPGVDFAKKILKDNKLSL